MQTNSIIETDNKISNYLSGLLRRLEEMLRDPFINVSKYIKDSIN
jgi:hypothetical protein